MKKIGQLLSQKDLGRRDKLDEKAIFYVFTRVIRELYGNKGAEFVQPDFYKNGKIFVKSSSSNWANEIWLNKDEIMEKINSEIGAVEISELNISNG